MFYVLGDRLSEQDILLLQELFWQEGIHSLEVDSSAAAHFLLKTFLCAIPHYSQLGCMSLSTQQKLPVKAENLALSFHKELTGEGYKFFIDQLLLKEFYYDFFWIEYDTHAPMPEWLSYFIQKMDDYRLGTEKTILLFPLKGD